MNIRSHLRTGRVLDDNVVGGFFCEPNIHLLAPWISNYQYKIKINWNLIWFNRDYLIKGQ